MRKPALIAALLLATSSASAQNISQNEETCLIFGNTAKAAAEALKRGVPERDLLRAANQNATDKHSRATLAALVGYVATVGAPPDVARSMVYAKCKAGEYDVGRLAVR